MEVSEVWRTRDHAGRLVILTHRRLDHVLERHPDLVDRFAGIRSAIEAPDRVTRDDGYPHRENFYASAGVGTLMLKVVVHYRPVPPQGTWEGSVVTAHPTKRVDPKELPLWP